MEPKELRERYVEAQVVMVTPFEEEYSLDEERLKSKTSFLIENYVNEPLRKRKAKRCLKENGTAIILTPLAQH